MALIKCKNCGHLISDKAQRCPKCSSPVQHCELPQENDAVPPSYSTHISTEKEEEYTEESNIIVKTSGSKKGLKWFLIILGSILIVTFIYIGYRYLNNDIIEKTSSNVDSIHLNDDMVKITSPDVVKITPSFIDSIHQYDELYPFSEGLAAVRKGDKFGFINMKGELVVPCKYKLVGPFSEELAVVIEDYDYPGISDNPICFINKEGKVYKTKYKFWAGQFSSIFYNYNCYLDFEDFSKFKFINGICKIPYAKEGECEEECEEYSEDHEVYIDKNLNEVQAPNQASTPKTPIKEYEIFSISSKDIYGDDDKLYGLKKATGEIVIPAKYDYLQICDNGVVLATLFVEDAKSHLYPYIPYGMSIYGYIDLKGNSTFTETDLGKIEGYKAAQLSVYDDLLEQEREKRGAL